jgi:hypothetical protein
VGVTKGCFKVEGISCTKGRETSSSVGDFVVNLSIGLCDLCGGSLVKGIGFKGILGGISRIWI